MTELVVPSRSDGRAWSTDPGDRFPKKKRKNPAAVALGRKGGKVTSLVKAAAARRNGAKGGRPPKPQ